MVILRKLGDKVVFRVGRVRFSAHAEYRFPIESAGQCLALTRWNHAVSGVPQVMMSPVQQLQLGVGCHFRNMTVPCAGTGNSESAGTAHVKGPVLMAGSWYLCLQQETACSMSCVELYMQPTLKSRGAPDGALSLMDDACGGGVQDTAVSAVGHNVS